MKFKSITIIILSYSVLAGVGEIGNDFKVTGLGDLASNPRSRGTNDLGNDFKVSGSEAIINYYEKLKYSEKKKKLLELPVQVEIKVDRDFISPINRWTLQTTNRKLLVKEYESLIEYDEIKEELKQQKRRRIFNQEKSVNINLGQFNKADF